MARFNSSISAFTRTAKEAKCSFCFSNARIRASGWAGRLLGGVKPLKEGTYWRELLDRRSDRTFVLDIPSSNDEPTAGYGEVFLESRGSIP